MKDSQQSAHITEKEEAEIKLQYFMSSVVMMNIFMLFIALAFVFIVQSKKILVVGANGNLFLFVQYQGRIYVITFLLAIFNTYHQSN